MRTSAPSASRKSFEAGELASAGGITGENHHPKRSAGTRPPKEEEIVPEATSTNASFHARRARSSLLRKGFSATVLRPGAISPPSTTVLAAPSSTLSGGVLSPSKKIFR